ncbi:MAG TPA: sigma-70 family RNA polymerase sigma factor [Pirellulaceae bacterium]|nr:sigma-70 family RNA polymerase sigma factor [Pirellulaceae bacterium]
MSIAPDTRSSLIARLADMGDNDAWREFASLYEPFIYRQARQFGLQHADARELVQEVLVAVSTAVTRFTIDKHRGRFRTWLYAVGRNICLQYLSKLRACERGSGDSQIRAAISATPDPSSIPPRELTLELRRHAFLWVAHEVRAEFQSNTWRAFWRTAVENHSIQNTATDLQMSVGSVYIARSRVMARLRQRVQEVTLDGVPEALDILELAAAANNGDAHHTEESAP